MSSGGFNGNGRSDSQTKIYLNNDEKYASPMMNKTTEMNGGDDDSSIVPPTNKSTSGIISGGGKGRFILGESPSVVFLPIPMEEEGTEKDDGGVINSGASDGSGGGGDDDSSGGGHRIRTTSASFDPWELPEINLDEGTPWRDMSGRERGSAVIVGVGKALGLAGLLYAFVCSLDLLSQAFRLVGGRAAGEVFRDSELLQNPICGLMIGVLATVLLQSSSTSTSIVVSMVAAEILTVRVAIPIVMGANIGTSMTNTLVSVAHSSKRAEFRRAFAGATVHDMFNWLCVIILLPLEAAFGWLYLSSDFVVSKIGVGNDNAKPPKLLKVITDPLTKLIIQLDKSKIKAIALGKVSSNDTEDFTLIKKWCKGPRTEAASGLTAALAGANETTSESSTLMEKVACRHIFAHVHMSDLLVGIILLIVSLSMLIACLIFIVKLLHSMLKGKIAAAIRKTINNDFPAPFGFLTGYAAIVLGMVMTILVQSSSVFTSALTPLVGIGVLSLERMYPLTLGANVGTTFTSVLAAMAAPPERLAATLQISLCHLFFNLSGILLFYPIPATRRAPIALAKLLGNKTSKYRWVAVLYVATMFFLLPGAIFGLSMAGGHVLMGVGVPFLSLLAVVVLMNVLQSACPKCLPRVLRTWSWLPKWMHSLEPLDSAFTCLSRALPRRWTSCCYQAEPDPTNALPIHKSRASESRKQLLQSGSTPGASANPSRNPSRFPSRSSSPNTGRKASSNNGGSKKSIFK